MFRALALGIAMTIAAVTAALSDDVPFATPPVPPPVAALSDIMGKIQLRHIKLWRAYRSKNWELLGYELRQTRESFDTAVALYESIPIELIVAVDSALGAIQQAVKAKDGPSLERGFADLTGTANDLDQAPAARYPLQQFTHATAQVGRRLTPEFASVPPGVEIFEDLNQLLRQLAVKWLVHRWCLLFHILNV